MTNRVIVFGTVFFSLVISGAVSAGRINRSDQKLPASEVVAKHLDSLGPADARAKLQATQFKGTCTITVRQGGTGQVDGSVVMVSHGDQNLINMTFDSPDYPLEAFKYDGKKFTSSQVRPGRRTPLGNFFVVHEILFKEGLVGGVLSSSWPLLNVESKSPRLEYLGIKKIDGKDLHALKYVPRKGSDIKITLYFDTANFRHVRTDYQRTIYESEQRKIAGGGGAMPSAQDQRSANARIEASEEFSDFKPEGGLNLPHNYKFHLSIQSETAPALVDWEINLTDFVLNPQLDAKWFGGGS